MFELVKTFFAYNSWATARLLDALEKLTPEQYTEPGCSGHGSICDTLAHLMTSQWGWLSWLDGSLTVSQSYLLKVTSESIDTPAKARERWLPIDTQTIQFIDSLTNEKLRDIWTWSLPNGRSDSLPLWKLLMQVASHGTHMRAQIIACVRRAGHEPPRIDFLDYSLTVR